MMHVRSLVFILVVVLNLNINSALAAPDQYDDTQSNPLRVAAYLLHPVGWLAEWIVFRPFHFLVSATEPQEAVFGHRPHPPVLAEPQPMHDYGTPRRVPLNQSQAEPTVTGAAQPVESVRVVEVPVEKTVIKEVTKVVEVEKVIFPAIAFRFDSAELTELGKGQVYLAAQRLKEKNDITVVIEGHTDAAGSEEYNRNLAQRRARTVMSALAAQGIDPSRMSTAGIGENEPLIPRDTQWARAVNRRVEFQVKAAR